MRDPRRILIVRLSHLGDVVHALGVFHALHAAYPRAEIGWAIQPEFAALLRGLPGLARVFLFGRRGGAGAWLRIARELSRFRADLVVDAQGNAKSAAVAWLARGARRVASAASDWQEPWAAWLGGERAPALPADERHAMQRMERLARHLVPETRLPLRTDAGLSPRERARGAAALQERLQGAGGAAPVLVHLTDPADVRAWPLESWVELGRALRAEGRPVLVLSGPREALAGEALARALPGDPGLVHWRGQDDLRELAGVFEAAALRGSRLIACDSGPMHLAAACGLRVTALEGPQDERRTGPWPASLHRVVRAREAPACAPCLAHRCSHREGPVCMSHLAVEDVLATLG